MWVLISKPPWTQHRMLLYKVLMNCPMRQPCFCSRLQRTRLKCNSQLFPSSRVLASAPQWPQLSYKYSKRQSLWQLLKCSFQLVTKRRMIILLTIKTDPHVAKRNPEQHYVMSKFKLCLHSKGSPSPLNHHNGSLADSHRRQRLALLALLWLNWILNVA